MKSAGRDQQWMEEMCDLVKNKIPDTHVFVVFAFPVATTDRMFYASNAKRNDAVTALREWLAHQEGGDKWLKHEVTDEQASQS